MIKKKQGGRPLGAKNIISEAMRQSLSDVLQFEIDGLKARFNGLFDIQRIELLVKLLPYVVPKLATEINITEQSLPDRFDFDIEVLDGDGNITSTHKISNEKNTHN
jgi:hypothetical protein